MAGSSLIPPYLAELQRSMPRSVDVDDVIAEVGDHLLEAVDRLTASGMARDEAEHAVLERFGSVDHVAGAFARMGTGAVVPTTFTRSAGAAGVMAFALLAGALLLGRSGAGAASAILTAAGIGGIVAGVVGVFRRQRPLSPRLSGTGLALVLVSPVLPLALSWSGLVFGSLTFGLGLLLLGVVTWRGGVLPRGAAALTIAGPVLAAVFGSVMSALRQDAGQYFPVAMTIEAVGLVWLFGALWREQAESTGPAAVA